jgi:hypothetical protein
MQLIAQLFLSRAPSNEVFHNMQFIDTPSFKTTRVVEYEAWVALENHFILDIVPSSLRWCKFASEGSLYRGHTLEEGITTTVSI